MLRLQSADGAELSALEKILEISKGPLLALNELIAISTDTLVTMYYGAFWRQVGQSEVHLATGRAMLFVGMVGLAVAFIGTYLEAHSAYKEPLDLPAGPPRKLPSAQKRARAVTGAFLTMVGIMWVSMHIVASALKPFAYHIERFR